MRLLVDTCALIWAVDQSGKLGEVARLELVDPDNDLVVSAASIWEISIKMGIGKLTLSRPFRQWIEQAIHALGAAILPISIAAADAQMSLPDPGSLPVNHKDPFDRMLIAQSQIESIAIISNDGNFDMYGTKRIW